MTCYLHSLLWKGIHFSYAFKIFSSILPFSPIPNFRNMPFVLKGFIFLYFLNSFFYDPLLLSHSMLLGGGGCCVSNYVSFNFFSSLLCPSILWEGPDFLYLRKVSCIIPDCSIISYFEGVGLAYFLAVCYSSLSEGVDYQSFFSKLLYDSILFRKMLFVPFWMDGILCVFSKVSFAIHPCSIIPYFEGGPAWSISLQNAFYPHFFLKRLIDFIYFWEGLFYHPLLLAHSILLRGLISLLSFKILFNHPFFGLLGLLPCNVLLYLFIPESGYWLFFFGKFLLSSCIVLSVHATRKTSFYLIRSFGKGFIFIYLLKNLF